MSLVQEKTLLEDQAHREEPESESFPEDHEEDNHEDYNAGDPEIFAPNDDKEQDQKKTKSSTTKTSRRSDVSDRLLKPTASRVRDNQVLEEKKRQKDASPPKRKIDNNYVPSDRLMKTTQSRIASVKEWETHKERSKYEDDIWWEMRKPAEAARIKPGTPSKLYDATTSYAQSTRVKYDKQPESPPKEIVIPAKIDSESPLLKKTLATKASTWKPEIVVESPKPGKLVLPSQQTGPQHVESKLGCETKSSRLNKWRNKEEETQQLASPPSAPSSAHKVKEVSPRLLELNESLKYSVRPKAARPAADPRELGWNTKCSFKPHIPTLDELHEVDARHSVGNRHSRQHSPVSGSCSGSVEGGDQNHVILNEDGHEDVQVESEIIQEDNTAIGVTTTTTTTTTTVTSEERLDAVTKDLENSLNLAASPTN
jgi:hypothetical protein